MSNIIQIDTIKSKIHTVRGLQVLLDRDLAELYGVDTKVLNQAVKRNIQRFPENFMFQLTEKEFMDWRSQIVTSKSDQMGLRRPPYAFTEHGISMLSAILRSETAIKISIQIIEAFVTMRKFIFSNAQLFQRLGTVEREQIEHKIETDRKFNDILELIESKDIKPSKGIFFDGQVFDAYKFVSDLVEKARSVVLIDNYIDESVLEMFSNCKEVVIYTKNVSKKLELAVEKFNQQYGRVVLRKFNKSHDRFMIIDKKEVYHFGASLKDLGKKWFAFSKFDKEALEVLSRLK